MPLLLYCITEAHPAVQTNLPGVEGARIAYIDESGLRCFFSKAAETVGAISDLKHAAVAFNRVLQDLLQKAAVVPFRFPTVLEDETRIVGLLREKAGQHKPPLSRLRNMVQMEVQITYLNGDERSNSATLSGVDYLRSRQQRYHQLAEIVAELTRRVEHQIDSSRQRTTADGARVYALLPRDAVLDFQQRVARLKIPPGLNARVTGPWPATEFLEEN